MIIRSPNFGGLFICKSINKVLTWYRIGDSIVTEGGVESGTN